jgi:hypothetical protein
MTPRANVSEFDRTVLFAIRQLDDAAYGPEIARALEQDAGRSVSRGALYTALDRLEKKGLVRWRIEDATAERGGYPRRRFEVAPSVAPNSSSRAQTRARPDRAKTRTPNGGRTRR